MRNINKIKLIITVALTILLACADDSEDKSALKSYLSTEKHEQHLTGIVNCIDFLGYGYDNVVSKSQLDSMKNAADAYLAYLDGYAPKFKSTRQILSGYQETARTYRDELDRLPARIDAYRAVCNEIDSLEAQSRESKAIVLRNQRDTIRESITNRFLMKRTQMFLDEIAGLFERLD
ncbi:hypothetical protein JXJ21_02510 [candidate division KSB1 bacterium]|nr:hypothetical protein [candidate division KSB1 bacterium]